VDAFSKLIWVRLLRTPKGAGVAAAWTGLKRNPEVIGVAKALDSIFTEIDADLQDETPPRRLRDLTLKFGSDNGNEFFSPDIDGRRPKTRLAMRSLSISLHTRTLSNNASTSTFLTMPPTLMLVVRRAGATPFG
jgi:hypothetical protein